MIVVGTDLAFRLKASSPPRFRSFSVSSGKEGSMKYRAIDSTQSETTENVRDKKENEVGVNHEGIEDEPAAWEAVR